MITARPIANGSTYLGNHLRANDYYAEGESVQGQWWGQGAERLGLRGHVEEPQFEALRTNRHPFNNTKLTARNGKKNAFHDITINAPKSVSILAVVGGDERVREAFKESVNVALTELEKHAAVRERTGSNASTNNTRPTGNVIAAVFHHDSSRLLDPQLHAHAVLTNATYDPERQRWFALQPKPMMEASPLITRHFRQDLAQRIEKLGYQVTWNQGTFHIQGITKEMEHAFSQRTQQRDAFIQRYRNTFGKEPDKNRVADFIREGKTAATKRFKDEYHQAFGKRPTQAITNDFVQDWRSAKLKEVATHDVRRLQKSRLTLTQQQSLQQTVASATSNRTTTQKPNTQPQSTSQAHRTMDHQSPSQTQPPKRSQRPAQRPKRAPRARHNKTLLNYRRSLALQAAFRGRPHGIVRSNMRRLIAMR